DPVINMTAGMGGDLVLNPANPTEHLPGTDLVSGLERLAHVEELRPEVCTIDCGSLNFGEGSLVYISTPDMLRQGPARIRDLGVRPETEIIVTVILCVANLMVEEGLVAPPPLYQLCMGIPCGAPADVGLVEAMVKLLPDDAQWASFSV